MAAILVLAAAGSAALRNVAAATTPNCAKADARLAATGKGDKDHDGLSDCAEKKLLGTNPLDNDSDDDGLADGDEVATGTDPLDDDSDDDGTKDGADSDPAHELRSEITGTVQTLNCAGSTLTILGIPITLTDTTKYEGTANCDELAVKLGTNGGAHVEVEVTGDATTALVAQEVSLDDADNDGSPDDVDDDDNNDGTPDDH